MKSILDPKFRYVPASKTDVAATFRRIRKEQAVQSKNVTKLPERRKTG